MGSIAVFTALKKRGWETAETAPWKYEEQSLTFEASLGDILIF